MSFFKTCFNTDWIDQNLNPQFAFWVESVDGDPYKARCRLCMRSFSLSNMGRQALTSHAKRKKHLNLVAAQQKNQTLSRCFSNTSTKNEVNIETPSTATNEGEAESEVNAVKKEVSKARKSTSQLLNFVDKGDVLKAEVIWAMKIVMSHSSYNSYKDAAEIFQLMFPDSDIAKKVTLGSSKMAYVVAYGLSPYFYKELLEDIGKNTKFVLCLDEALNTISQKGQMDLIIRYWPENCNEVQVRFLNSVFLGHSTAQDLYEKFLEGSSDLDLSNLLQISIDGPYVNLKFLKTLQDEIKENKGHALIKIGTCSLHVLHNAFQRGNKITKWKLNEILSAFYRMFKDSPARRSDYISLTDSDVFPLKFCHVRWVENVKVAERALEVFPNVKKYYDSYKSNLPHNVSISNIESACDDKLILSKISFFSSIASMLEPFLKKFQSPEPLVPFIYDSISELMRKIMMRFIKRESISDAKTSSQLFDIDVTMRKNHLRIQDMDIGVAARSYMNRSDAGELAKTQFLNECRDFFVEMSSKIIEKFQVNFAVLKALSCLNPILIKTNSLLSEKRMDYLLQILHDSNNLSALSADCAKQQFITFIQNVKTEFKDEFLAFTEHATRLDTFYFSMLSNRIEFKDLWVAIKLVLTLSHGNASVESGFSINKDVMIENLKENSLIALRRTYDAIKSKGGVNAISVTPEMMQYAKLSRTRYHIALEESKKQKENEIKKVNEKRKIKDQIKLLQAKKAKLSKEATLQTQKLNEEIHELEKNLN